MMILRASLVYAEEITLQDDSHSTIVTQKDETKIVTMSNGTEFTIKQKTSFDKVFNEFNAPGYWSDNEMVTDKEVVTMTHHESILPPHDASKIHYGLGHAAKANVYASKIHEYQNVDDGNSWSDETFQGDPDAQALNHLLEMPIDQQAQKIAESLFLDIRTVFVSGSYTNIKDIIIDYIEKDIHTVLWEFDPSKDDIVKEELCLEILGLNYGLIHNEANNLSEAERQILAHINVHIRCYNETHVQHISFRDLIHDSKHYNELFSLEMTKEDVHEEFIHNVFSSLNTNVTHKATAEHLFKHVYDAYLLNPEKELSNTVSDSLIQDITRNIWEISPGQKSIHAHNAVDIIAINRALIHSDNELSDVDKSLLAHINTHIQLSNIAIEYDRKLLDILNNKGLYEAKYETNFINVMHRR